MTAASDVPIEQIKPCRGSGLPWDIIRSLSRGTPKACPECDAGPATLRVPDDEPKVPDHPNIVVWSGRVDVVRWRQIHATIFDSKEN